MYRSQDPYSQSSTQSNSLASYQLQPSQSSLNISGVDRGRYNHEPQRPVPSYPPIDSQVQPSIRSSFSGTMGSAGALYSAQSSFGDSYVRRSSGKPEFDTLTPIHSREISEPYDTGRETRYPKSNTFQSDSIGRTNAIDVGYNRLMDDDKNYSRRGLHVAGETSNTSTRDSFVRDHNRGVGFPEANRVNPRSEDPAKGYLYKDSFPDRVARESNIGRDLPERGFFASKERAMNLAQRSYGGGDYDRFRTDSQSLAAPPMSHNRDHIKSSEVTPAPFRGEPIYQQDRYRASDRGNQNLPPSQAINTPRTDPEAFRSRGQYSDSKDNYPSQNIQPYRKREDVPYRDSLPSYKDPWMERSGKLPPSEKKRDERPSRILSRPDGKQQPRRNDVKSRVEPPRQSHSVNSRPHGEKRPAENSASYKDVKRPREEVSVKTHTCHFCYIDFDFKHLLDNHFKSKFHSKMKELISIVCNLSDTSLEGVLGVMRLKKSQLTSLNKNARASQEPQIENIIKMLSDYLLSNKQGTLTLKLVKATAVDYVIFDRLSAIEKIGFFPLSLPVPSAKPGSEIFGFTVTDKGFKMPAYIANRPVLIGTDFITSVSLDYCHACNLCFVSSLQQNAHLLTQEHYDNVKCYIREHQLYFPGEFKFPATISSIVENNRENINFITGRGFFKFVEKSKYSSEVPIFKDDSDAKQVTKITGGKLDDTKNIGQKKLVANKILDVLPDAKKEGVRGHDAEPKDDKKSQPIKRNDNSRKSDNPKEKPYKQTPIKQDTIHGKDKSKAVGKTNDLPTGAASQAHKLDEIIDEGFDVIDDGFEVVDEVN